MMVNKRLPQGLYHTRAEKLSCINTADVWEVYTPLNTLSDKVQHGTTAGTLQLQQYN